MMMGVGSSLDAVRSVGRSAIGGNLSAEDLTHENVSEIDGGRRGRHERRMRYRDRIAHSWTASVPVVPNASGVSFLAQSFRDD
jgi:hypothetical protein